MSDKKKIIITSIYAYCGGTIVLFTLCKELRRLGYDARMFLVPNFGWEEDERKHIWRDYVFKTGKRLIKHYLRMLVILLFPYARVSKRYKSLACDILQMPGIKLKILPWFDKASTIVVYPDDQYGNPLNSQNVIRWLLMTYKFEGNKNAYSDNDVFIAYRKVFNSQKLNPKGYCVTISYFDSSLYRQYYFGERTGTFYILHKGKNRKDLPAKFDGPVYIDSQSMSQFELVEHLNHCEKCYCYDTQSFFSTVSVVCGCKCIVVLESGKTEKDYLGPGEQHLGVAYGETPEQLKYAEETREELLKSLDFEPRNRKNTEKMVRIMEENYGKLIKIKSTY